ncbi:MAG: PAS domain-containing protein [Verrucomicrobia bacterium]|nr:PAS domain-containing protein [Verrucomicrobiota bacterium]
MEIATTIQNAAPGNGTANRSASGPWKVLLVEARPDEAARINQVLLDGAGSPFELEWADGMEGALHRLASGGVDLVLLDLDLPDSRGLPGLIRLHACFPSQLVVVVVDHENEAVELEALREGALLCLPKTKLDPFWLARALRYSHDRAVAEEKLRAGLAFHRSIVEQLPHGIFRQDLQGRFTYANPFMSDLLGLPQHELVGRRSEEVFPKAVAERAVNQDQEVLRTGRPHERIEELDAPDGRRLCLAVSKTPVRNQQGRIIALQGLMMDETERHQAQAALEQERYFMHLLISNLPDPVYFKDTASRFIRVNQALAERLGGPNPEFMLGKTDFDFFAREHAEPAFHDEQTVMKTGQPIVGKEEKEVWPDGREKWVSTTKMPLRDRNGQIIGTFGLSRDITPRKKAEEKLRAYAASLAQSNRDLEEFAFVASHDLQEPLGKVQAFADLLLADCSDSLSEKGKDYLRRLHKATARMQMLVRGLLTFSRVQTEAQPFQPVDLSALVTEVMADLDTRIQQTGARVEVGPLGTVDGDAHQLRQVLQNLLGNALKFVRPGVAPIVKINSQRVLERVTGANLPMEVCRLSVEDNGIGIEGKYLGRLFNIFQRLRPNEYDGTGIGLATVRRIAQRHGGSVSVRSQPNEGSVFTVTLPVRQRRGDTSTTIP